MIKDDELLALLKEDYTRADLALAGRVLLDYAAKLTRTPGAVCKGDIESLREAGFDDRAILDIAQVTAYLAFVNRLRDGLGVALE